MRMLTGCGRGRRCPGGQDSNVPSIQTGTAGTPVRSSSSPTPGRKGCSRPSVERAPSGNQTRGSPRSRTVRPSVRVEVRPRSGSTGSTWNTRLNRRVSGPLNNSPAQPAQ